MIEDKGSDDDLIQLGDKKDEDLTQLGDDKDDEVKPSTSKEKPYIPNLDLDKDIDKEYENFLKKKIFLNHLKSSWKA